MDAMGMDGLQWGMFVGGAVMAAVPVTLGIGIGVYVLRRYLRTRREEEEISRTGRGSP
jgi:hypothetical protein